MISSHLQLKQNSKELKERRKESMDPTGKAAVCFRTDY